MEIDGQQNYEDVTIDDERFLINDGEYEPADDELPLIDEPDEIYDKATLEEMIEGSPLFAIDRIAEKEGYDIELDRMLEHLFIYSTRFQSKKYEKIGLEIFQTALRCIQSYDSSYGPFLHYYNAAISSEYKRFNADVSVDDKVKGMKLSDKDKDDYKRYMQVAEQIRSERNGELSYSVVSERTGLSIDRIREMEQMEALGYISESTRIPDGDGGNIDPYDLIPDEKYEIDAQLIAEEDYHEFMQKIAGQFNFSQKRQKRLLSDLLTIRLLPEYPELARQKYSFISREILDQWNKEGKLPTQKELAEKYDRKESSVSRTLSEFLEKIPRNRPE